MLFMIEHPDVIPIAVVVAVGIFLSREILDYFRRRDLNGRKLHAIKRFLAAECERNSFAIQQLIHQARDAEDACDDGWPIVIEKRESGLAHLRIDRGEGSYSSSVIRPVHTEALQNYLFEVASIDGKRLRNAALSAAPE